MAANENGTDGGALTDPAAVSDPSLPIGNDETVLSYGSAAKRNLPAGSIGEMDLRRLASGLRRRSSHMHRWARIHIQRQSPCARVDRVGLDGGAAVRGLLVARKGPLAVRAKHDLQVRTHALRQSRNGSQLAGSRNLVSQDVSAQARRINEFPLGVA